MLARNTAWIKALTNSFYSPFIHALYRLLFKHRVFLFLIKSIQDCKKIRFRSIVIELNNIENYKILRAFVIEHFWTLIYLFNSAFSCLLSWKCRTQLRIWNEIQKPEYSPGGLKKNWKTEGSFNIKYVLVDNYEDDIVFILPFTPVNTGWINLV